MEHLSEVLEFLNGRSELAIFKCDPDKIWNARALEGNDFEPVKGQEHAK